MSTPRETKCVRSNLLQQNCYVREATRSLGEHLDVPETYMSLDEVSTPSGVRQELREYPYHITPAYVDSFVESADYRRDPLGAIAQSKPRRNLGDIRDLQKVASMDMEQARELYSQLSALFSSKDKGDDPTPVDPTPVDPTPANS